MSIMSYVSLEEMPILLSLACPKMKAVWLNDVKSIALHIPVTKFPYQIAKTKKFCHMVVDARWLVVDSQVCSGL